LASSDPLGIKINDYIHPAGFDFIKKYEYTIITKIYVHILQNQKQGLVNE
jgi:hypothetical protein